MRSLAALACATIVLAGCGGGKQPSLAEFRSGYDSQRKILTDVPGQVGDAVGDTLEKTTGELAKELKGIEAQYRGRLGKLNELQPPKSKKEAFYAVTTGGQAVDEDILRILTATVANNGPGYKAATEKLVSDAAALRDAVAELNAELGLPQQAQDPTGPDGP